MGAAIYPEPKMCIRDRYHTVTADIRLMIWLCVWIRIRRRCCLFTTVDDDVVFYSTGCVGFDRSTVGQVSAASAVQADRCR